MIIRTHSNPFFFPPQREFCGLKCGLNLVKNGVYKAFRPTKSGKLKCLNKEYRVGKKSYARGRLEICRNGIHYCTNLFDIFTYYSGYYGEDFVIAECEVSDENIGGREDSKRCARWVIPKHILSVEELIKQLVEGEER